MITLIKQKKYVDIDGVKKKKFYYDISIIIDEDGNLEVIDNKVKDYHDFIDSKTKTIIPMIIKL